MWKLSVPAITSCNARSTFGKTDELGILHNTGVNKKIGIMRLQKTLLHSSKDTSLAIMDGFSTHRVDRHDGSGGGFAAIGLTR